MIILKRKSHKHLVSCSFRRPWAHSRTFYKTKEISWWVTCLQTSQDRLIILNWVLLFTDVCFEMGSYLTRMASLCSPNLSSAFCVRSVTPSSTHAITPTWRISNLNIIITVTSFEPFLFERKMDLKYRYGLLLWRHIVACDMCVSNYTLQVCHVLYYTANRLKLNYIEYLMYEAHPILWGW